MPLLKAMASLFSGYHKSATYSKNYWQGLSVRVTYSKQYRITIYKTPFLNFSQAKKLCMKTRLSKGKLRLYGTQQQCSSASLPYRNHGQPSSFLRLIVFIINILFYNAIFKLNSLFFINKVIVKNSPQWVNNNNLAQS